MRPARTPLTIYAVIVLCAIAALLLLVAPARPIVAQVSPPPDPELTIILNSYLSIMEQQSKDIADLKLRVEELQKCACIELPEPGVNVPAPNLPNL